MTKVPEKPNDDYAPAQLLQRSPVVRSTNWKRKLMQSQTYKEVAILAAAFIVMFGIGCHLKSLSDVMVDFFTCAKCSRKVFLIEEAGVVFTTIFVASLVSLTTILILTMRQIFNPGQIKTGDGLAIQNFPVSSVAEAATKEVMDTLGGE